MHRPADRIQEGLIHRAAQGLEGEDITPQRPERILGLPGLQGPPGGSPAATRILARAINPTGANHRPHRHRRPVDHRRIQEWPAQGIGRLQPGPGTAMGQMAPAPPASSAAPPPDSRRTRPPQGPTAPSAPPAGSCDSEDPERLRPALLLEHQRPLPGRGERHQAARAHGMGSGIKEPDPCPGRIKPRRMVLDADRADGGSGGDGRIGRGQPNQAPARGNPRQAL